MIAPARGSAMTRRDALAQARRALLTLLFGDMPDPLVSDVQAWLHAHGDLEQMSPAGLERERARVVMWHALEDDAARQEWLAERLQRIAHLRGSARRAG